MPRILRDNDRLTTGLQSSRSVSICASPTCSASWTYPIPAAPSAPGHRRWAWRGDERGELRLAMRDPIRDRQLQHRAGIAGAQNRVALSRWQMWRMVSIFGKVFADSHWWQIRSNMVAHWWQIGALDSILDKTPIRAHACERGFCLKRSPICRCATTIALSG